MCDTTAAAVTAYINAATALLHMPLDDGRSVAVTTNMLRIASFAADLGAVELGDDIEIAGAFIAAP